VAEPFRWSVRRFRRQRVRASVWVLDDAARVRTGSGERSPSTVCCERHCLDELDPRRTRRHRGGHAAIIGDPGRSARVELDVQAGGRSLRWARGAHAHWNQAASEKTSADLEGADLRDADLRGANLYEAETWEAQVSGILVEGAILARTKLALASD
jgi:hypothetical protein